MSCHAPEAHPWARGGHFGEWQSPETLLYDMRSRLRTCPREGYGGLCVWPFALQPQGLRELQCKEWGGPSGPQYLPISAEQAATAKAPVYIIQIDWAVPRRMRYVKSSIPFDKVKCSRSIAEVRYCVECEALWPFPRLEGCNYARYDGWCKISRSGALRCQQCEEGAGSPYGRPRTCICFDVLDAGSFAPTEWLDPWDAGLLPTDSSGLDTLP